MPTSAERTLGEESNEDDEERGTETNEEEEKREEAVPASSAAVTSKEEAAASATPAAFTRYGKVLNRKRKGNVTLDFKAFLWEEETTTNDNNGGARARILWNCIAKHEIQSQNDKIHLLRISAKGGNVLNKKQKLFQLQDRETLTRIHQDMETRMKRWSDAEEAEEAEALRGPSNVHEDEEENVLSAIRFPFPQAFYDPVTWKLMLDPVVDPAGDSYENDGDILALDVTYYPNRALKTYIENELDIFADVLMDDATGGASSSPSVRETLLEWGHTLRFTVRKLMERSALPTTSTTMADYNHKPLPDVFYCPISFDLIHEPVVDPDGHTYEKDAIVHWLQNNTESPMTRNPLREDELRPNKAFLRVLEFLTEEHDDANEEAIHPSIRRWKAEHRPTNTTTTRGDIEEGLAADVIADSVAAALSMAPDAVPTAASPPEATLPTSPPTTTFASNRQELEDMRLRIESAASNNTRRSVCTCGSIALAVVLILFIIPASYTFGVLFLFIVVLLIVAVPCRMASMMQNNMEDAAATRRSIARNATMHNHRRPRTHYQIHQLQDRQRRGRQRHEHMRAQRERRRHRRQQRRQGRRERRQQRRRNR